MNWFARLLRSPRMEAELDRELRFHIESQVADKVAAGMTEAEARRTTQLEFGGVEQVKEDCRESRGTLWVASIRQDLSFGARILARSPGFAATAILVLALGIGVCTLAFSLFNLVVLQSIPVRDPETLVGTQRRSPENIAPGVPYTSMVYYRDHAKTLSAVMGTMMDTPMALDHDEQRVKPSFVTANYFVELGASAAIGRLLDPSREEDAGSAPVAVLSYRLWQQRFEGDTSVVGRTVSLGGRPATVIGVAAQGFANLGTDDPDLWLPLAQHGYFVAGSRALDDPKFDGMLRMWARLAPGVTQSQAQQELLALTNQLRPLYPSVIWDHERIELSAGAHFFTMEDGAPVAALGGVLVLLILAVACANLGGLLMARGVSRQREIQMRLNLGARRSRVFRQLLTESLLLGLLGAMAALPLSYVVLRGVLVYANAPVWMSAVPDWRVLAFTASIGFVAALFFGLLPTLQMVRAKRGKARGAQFVVCAQVAASCVLLILTGLLVRATLHTLYSNPGFRYEQVLAINPDLGSHGYTPATAQMYLEQMQSRLRAVPGVASVALALSPPLVNENVMITDIHVDGRRVMIYPNWIGPEFFETIGVPLLRGRLMQAGEQHVVVLSESLARRRWPNEDPIGKPWKDGKNTVVGVVGNTRAMELNNTDATEIYYGVVTERMPEMSLLVKTAGSPEGVAPVIQTIAASLDPKLFPSITPLSAGFRKSVAQAEQIAALISLLGGIAIFLAVVGLLGLVTYAVTQRTREIAIRLALGASRAEIFAAVLRRFAWPVAVGLVLGVAMTAALSQVIRRGLFGISGLDPISYASAILLLALVLMMAALLPVRRAFRLDVARILHAE
jgi:predicted permease